MIDLDALVLGPCHAVWGQTVLYNLGSGVQVTMTGVFDEAASEIKFKDDGVPFSTENPILGVRLSSFPVGTAPLQNDTLVVIDPKTGQRKTYTVDDVNPDGHGSAKLKLKEA